MIVSPIDVQNILTSFPNSVRMGKIPDSQRALVLQGGGSLGAYEAGAYQALYERITKKDKEKGIKGKPLCRYCSWNINRCDKCCYNCKLCSRK